MRTVCGTLSTSQYLLVGVATRAVKNSYEESYDSVLKINRSRRLHDSELCLYDLAGDENFKHVILCVRVTCVLKREGVRAPHHHRLLSGSCCIARPEETNKSETCVFMLLSGYNASCFSFEEQLRNDRFLISNRAS